MSKELIGETVRMVNDVTPQWKRGETGTIENWNKTGGFFVNFGIRYAWCMDHDFKLIKKPKPIGKHYDKMIAGVKIDPYRIALEYGVTHPAHFQLLKKVLRAGSAHKTLAEDVLDMQAILYRWGEMLTEDGDI